MFTAPKLLIFKVYVSWLYTHICILHAHIHSGQSTLLSLSYVF